MPGRVQRSEMRLFTQHSGVQHHSTHWRQHYVCQWHVTQWRQQYVRCQAVDQILWRHRPMSWRHCTNILSDHVTDITRKAQLTQRQTRDSDACVKARCKRNLGLSSQRCFRLDGEWRLAPYPVHEFQYSAPRPMHEFQYWLTLGTKGAEGQMAPPSRADAPFEWLNASILKTVFKFHAPVGRIPWTQGGRGAKFKQVKTTFNAKSFIRKLSRSISSDFGAIRYWNGSLRPKSPKNP